MAFLQAYALLPGSPHGQCLTGEQSRKADYGINGTESSQFPKLYMLIDYKLDHY